METLNYSELEGSIMLADKSGWQPFQLSWSQGSLDVYAFLESNHVRVVITESAVSEMQHQTYCPNIFAGEHIIQGVSSSSVTCGVGSSESSFAFSSVNGALTTLSIDPYGFPVGIFHDHEIPKYHLLWEMASHWKSLSFPDKSIVFVARELTKIGKKFFILVNDRHLFSQLKFEGCRVLKSAQLLHWMKISGFVSPQKIRRIYEEWGKYDPGSVKKSSTFGELFLAK